MRDKDQKSLENLYENRILSEISSNYHNSPDNRKKEQKSRKAINFGEINPPDKSAPEYTRGLKPKPQISGTFVTPERIDLENLDQEERSEYKSSISNLRAQIIAVTQDLNPKFSNFKDKIETLIENRNLCMEIIKDIVLGFRSDDKYVKLLKPSVSINDYPNGDPVFIIVQDGEMKNILVLGIKGKFVSGATEYSDIKYKMV